MIYSPQMNKIITLLVVVLTVVACGGTTAEAPEVSIGVQATIDAGKAEGLKEKPEPTATLIPKPTATGTPEPTATATPKPTATATPEPTATATPTPTPTPMRETRDTPIGSFYITGGYTSNPTRLTNNDAEDAIPSWSPDGTKIAFISDRGGTDKKPIIQIYVMNTDGTNQTNISNDDDRWDAFPSWSSDGTRIAFASERDGTDQIYTMNTDGTNPTRLTNNDAEDEYPSWSPDGTKIAFTSDRDGNYEIYVMDYVSS
jgi:dipeptidyl aminopeptidase/acylaminoacyl peptidase